MNDIERERACRKIGQYSGLYNQIKKLQSKDVNPYLEDLARADYNFYKASGASFEFFDIDDITPGKEVRFTRKIFSVSSFF